MLELIFRSRGRCLLKYWRLNAFWWQTHIMAVKGHDEHKIAPENFPKKYWRTGTKTGVNDAKIISSEIFILGQKYHEINVSRPQFWYEMVSEKSLVSIPSSFLIYSNILGSMMNYLWKLRDLRRIYGYCNTLAIY